MTSSSDVASATACWVAGRGPTSSAAREERLALASDLRGCGLP